MAPPGRPNITSTRCISRLLISACAPVISLGSIGVLPYLPHLRWSAQSVYLYGLCRLWGLCRGMKTTSHLGGRKAHTAKDRRVRYETGTKMMLGLIGVVRIVVALLHDWEGLDKCLVAGQVGSPRGPPSDVVLFARHQAVRPSKSPLRLRSGLGHRSTLGSGDQAGVLGQRPGAIAGLGMLQIRPPSLELIVVHQKVDGVVHHVHHDPVAVGNQTDGATIDRLGSHVPDTEPVGPTRESAVGDQGTVAAPTHSLHGTGHRQHQIGRA